MIIGLTGGIASGKSAAADILQTLGAYIIDADGLARKAVEKGSEGFKRIYEVFPEVFEFGELNRKKLRSIVFADSAQADILDKILHPLILKLIKAELKNADGTCVLVAPLLFETGLQDLCDTVWQISADRDLRIKRAVKRDNVSVGDIEAIIARQMSDTEREKLADIVIHNNGTLEELKAKITNYSVQITNKD